MHNCHIDRTNYYDNNMVCVGNPIRHVMFCTANSACIFSWTSLVITSKVENITYLSIRSTFQKKHVLPIRRKGFDHNLKRIHSLSSNHGGISLQKVLDFYPRLRSVHPSLVAANYGHFGLLIFRTILGTNDHMRESGIHYILKVVRYIVNTCQFAWIE